MAKEGELRLLTESVMLGLAGAFAALLFSLTLRLCESFFLQRLAGYVPPGLPEEGGILRVMTGVHGLWLIPLATTAGGLLSGLIVYHLAPEAEGHGTDTAVRAFHRTDGYIRARVAPVKLVASAITIGSGGAAGREGPTALIGAGVGSIYASLARRTDEQRRLLVLAGMAAGLSAVFRSPIGAAFFAIEVLYGSMEFEAAALLYTMLASIVAYAVHGLFVGFSPLFAFPAEAGLLHPADYAWYGILGIGCGFTAAVIPETFYRTRDAFRALPAPLSLKPAIGGLLVGLIALAFPQVLGGGYGWIQEAINGQMALQLMLFLLIAKILAFALTVSSGGSGGVFAPTLFVGAMLGGSLAAILHLPSAAFVVVGMAAVFGAAARVPIASVIMVTEMTGGYRSLVPATFAVVIAYLLQTWLSGGFKYTSLYENQVPTRAQSPARYLEHVLLAMDLLGRREIPKSLKIGHLNLVTLLDSGIPVQLSGRQQLAVENIHEHSPLAGRTVQSCFTDVSRKNLEIAAIVRAGKIILPEQQTVLETGDRLLLIGTAEARGKFENILGAKEPPAGSAASPSELPPPPPIGNP